MARTATPAEVRLVDADFLPLKTDFTIALSANHAARVLFRIISERR